jgi:outer membrane lipoprotein SlyB
MMKKTIIALAAVAALAGCTTAEKTATVGALGGAAIGGIATGTGTGAIIGAAAGGLGGYIVGKAIDNRPGYCEYRDRRTGRTWIERC